MNNPSQGSKHFDEQTGKQNTLDGDHLPDMI